MTNALIRSYIEKYGDRIFAFGFDNAAVLYIGYQSGIKLSDIELVTDNGVDLIVVNRIAKTHGKEISYQTFNVTSKIQWVGVMSEKDKDYRVDPLILR